MYNQVLSNQILDWIQTIVRLNNLKKIQGSFKKIKNLNSKLNLF